MVRNTGGVIESVEPARERPEAEMSARMARLRRRDTTPELALRKELHHRGLRYRVQYPVPTASRRTIDIAFTRLRLAVFLDGCFWHGCPDHGTRPTTNSEWWRWKLDRNRARDVDTTALLEEAGWTVLRIWEHVPTPEAAARVARAVTRIRGRSRPVRDT